LTGEPRWRSPRPPFFVLCSPGVFSLSDYYHFQAESNRPTAPCRHSIRAPTAVGSPSLICSARLGAPLLHWVDGPNRCSHSLSCFGSQGKCAADVGSPPVTTVSPRPSPDDPAFLQNSREWPLLAARDRGPPALDGRTCFGPGAKCKAFIAALETATEFPSHSALHTLSALACRVRYCIRCSV